MFCLKSTLKINKKLQHQRLCSKDVLLFHIIAKMNSLDSLLSKLYRADRAVHLTRERFLSVWYLVAHP